MQSSAREVHVRLDAQTLELREGDAVLRTFPISSSALGPGHEEGSLKTPTGAFVIDEKIGDDAPLGAIFKSRELTGELGSPEHSDDLVQTRVLWLHGVEEHNANTRDRFIYIHGTNHEAEIGQPASHGCIRMRNKDVAELYAQVDAGTPVFIRP